MKAATLETALLAHAPDAIILADCAGVIRLWNPGAETLFGYSAADAVGHTLDLIVPAPLRAAHWAGFHRAVQQGRFAKDAVLRTSRALTKHGSRITVELSAAIIRNHAGHVVGIMAIGRDVTARRASEQAQREHIAHLEQQVAALTQEMAVGRLLAMVGALVWRQTDGKYLLLQRSEAKDFAAGQWECVTGRLEQGESFMQAVRRETFEELGLEVSIECILGTTHFYRGDALPENEMVGVHYGCSIHDATRLQLSDEHCAYQWVTAAQAEALFSVGHWLRALIARAEAGRRWLPPSGGAWGARQRAVPARPEGAAHVRWVPFCLGLERRCSGRGRASRPGAQRATAGACCSGVSQRA